MLRRRVVVTGFGAVTPIGHSVTTSWQNLLKGKTGMIALSSSNLENVPHHFFPKSVMKNPDLQKSILDALPANVIAPVPEIDNEFINPGDNHHHHHHKEMFSATSRTTRHDLFAQFAAIEAMSRSGLLVLRHSKTKEILLDTSTTTTTAAFNDNNNNSGEDDDMKFLELYRQVRKIFRENKNSVSVEFNTKFDSIYPSDRRGVNIGIGMNSLHDVSETSSILYHQPPPIKLNRIEPFFIPKILCNTVSGSIAQMFQLMGPSHCTSTACATGLHCIGDGMRWIQHGDADLVVCGATEAAITPLGLAGFGRMKALANKAQTNEEAQSASSPFDDGRTGFVMGEGAGVLVLEDREKAIARGLNPDKDFLCELGGYGMAGDAYHVSSPHPEGLGAGSAMRNALRDFDRHQQGMESSSTTTIDYLNAHATSTPMGDEIELAAAARELRATSGADSSSKKLIVSSNKGNIGHLLGAAGSVEAIFAIQALRHKKAPVTANLKTPCTFDKDKLQLLPDEGSWSFMTIDDSSSSSSSSSNDSVVKENKNKKKTVVMSTSFGFGGTNAAIILTE